MSTQKRTSVFETNSSSMHSLTVSNFKNNNIHLELNTDRSITIPSMDFSEVPDGEYNDPLTKAAYLRAMLDEERVYSIGNKFTEEDYEDCLTQLKDAIQEHTGAREVYFGAYYDMGNPLNWDIKQVFDGKKETIKQYLFDTGSYLKIGY